MSGVDDRIVSIKFDNVAFERNIADTLRSLERLRQSLDFSGSTRGLADLSNSTKNFNMKPLSEAADEVGNRFSAMSVVAIAAIATIVSKAVAAGARMLSAFSFAPINQGFKEYETNMNSIQTIMANTDSKGTSLEQVNAALDRMNTYADQTIYNFAEMARNIGTFTAAGVGLEDSEKSIKGIANLAAISGSNSEQASTAMYQLSQAIAGGSLRLMDWNSVVNAGMGGEVFQKALFETGKAMGTLQGVPLAQTFDQWKDAGNNFRLTLQQGWITGDVLTNTLAGFTGDLTEAQLMAIGYTKEQAAEVQRLGKIGVSAATEVKTFTQLISTVKESLGSGWSQTFKLLVGDFNEAKKLFTGLNSVISGFVGKTSDARNNLLKGWKELGGRDTLLQGFENAFAAIGALIGPIVNAFRDIFPPMTVQRLFQLTEGFERFTKGLRVSQETSENIRRTFAGLFAVVEIGWNIFKGLIGVIMQLVGGLSGAGQGFLGATASVGDFLVSLNKVLVDGGAIARFFENVGTIIQKVIGFIKDIAGAVADFFKGFSENKVIEAGLSGIEQRMDSLSTVSDKLGSSWKSLSSRFEGFGKIVSKIWEGISDWFSELGNRLAEAIGPDSFNSVFDAINTGLLAGITLLIAKFLKNGFKFDIGSGAIDKIGKSFEQLTGTLKSMQLKLKAEALMKIAIAIGILTISVLTLSTINPEALTAALTAMAAGFTELVAVFAILNVITAGPTSAAKLAIVSAAIMGIAAAMVILSVAVKIMSTLGWEELSRGLVGIAAGLLIIVGAMQLLPPSPGMIASGIAMIAISTALLSLSKAVKSFAEFSWAEMAKGLVGVAGGLAVLIAAMHLMPPHMVAMGLGLIAVSTALLILSKAVESFGNISWTVMGKGLVGIGGALVVIAGAMWLMPPHMIATATALVIVSAALLVMAQAVDSMGKIKFGDMAKGIGAIAIMLGILAVAMIAMTGTIGGAAALVIVTAALLGLTVVMKILGDMEIKEIAIALLALAGVLVVLGVGAALLTPVIPMLLGLGVALTLIGAGMMLFGAGAFLVVKAFEALAKAGKVGMTALVEIIKIFVTALPDIATALAKSLLKFAEEILKGTPVIVRLVEALLIQLLETIIRVTPKLVEAFGTIITNALIHIREKFPDVMQTAYELLIKFLHGVLDHIDEIVDMAIKIVVTISDTLIRNADKLVTAATNLIVAFLNAIGDKAVDIVNAGVDLVLKLLQGISDNLIRFAQAAADIVIHFLNELATVIREKTPQLIEAGANIGISIAQGIIDGLERLPVVGKAIELGKKVLSGLKNALDVFSPSRIATKYGRYVVEGLAIGLKEKFAERAASKQGEMLIKSLQKSISGQTINLSDLGDFEPVITPVLDLTRVRTSAKELTGLMSVSTITPNVSYERARNISKSTNFEPETPDLPVKTEPTSVMFEQNIYSPTPLSTNDIYRTTRSQIVMAKEELSIP